MILVSVLYLNASTSQILGPKHAGLDFQYSKMKLELFHKVKRSYPRSCTFIHRWQKVDYRYVSISPLWKLHLLISGIISFCYSNHDVKQAKIQQIKMLVMCQRFGDLFLFGLVWQYSTNQNQYDKGKCKIKSWLLTCSSNITLSLHSYTGSALKRELNFCNGYLSLLYF